MRKIPFLSVSALSQFETQPNKFYLQRLADQRSAREPQGLPAAVGTYFDIYVKMYLLTERLLIHGTSAILKDRFVNYPWVQEEKRNKSLQELFMESLEPQNRIEEVFSAGKKMFDAYKKSKLFLDTPFYDVDIKNKFNLELKLAGKPVCVPIYVIVDALVGATDDMCRPMDLKVSGYGSGASPKPGYWCSFDSEGLALGAHENCPGAEGCFATLIDPDWATQGCVYGWGTGKKFFEPFEFEIHAGYFGKPKLDGSRSIKICGYRGTITVDFQKMVAMRLIKAWDIITSQTGDKPWDSEELLCEMSARSERWHG